METLNAWWQVYFWTSDVCLSMTVCLPEALLIPAHRGKMWRKYFSVFHLSSAAGAWPASSHISEWKSLFRLWNGELTEDSRLSPSDSFYFLSLSFLSETPCCLTVCLSLCSQVEHKHFLLSSKPNAQDMSCWTYNVLFFFFTSFQNFIEDVPKRTERWRESFFFFVCLCKTKETMYSQQ